MEENNHSEPDPEIKKEDLKEAKKRLSEANELIGNLKMSQTEIEQIINDIKVRSDQSSQNKNIIDELRENANASLNSLQSTIETINGIVSTTQNAAREIEDTKKSSTETLNTIKEEKDKSSALIVEIESIRNTVNTHTNEIDSFLNKAKELNTQLETDISEFRRLSVDLNNPENGLEAVITKSRETLEKIQTINEQSIKLRKDITEYRDNSNILYSEIKKLKDDSSADQKHINNLFNSSTATKTKIDEIYKFAADIALGNSFTEQASKIDKHLWVWAVLSISSFIILGIAGFLALFLNISDSKIILTPPVLEVVSLLRIALTTPFIASSFFVSAQYINNRNLREKYEFKAVTSLSLESYTQILTNRFSEKEYKDEILKFVISSMEMIYKEPYSYPKETKSTVSFNSKLAEVKAEIVEKTNTVGEKIIEEIEERVPKVTN